MGIGTIVKEKVHFIIMNNPLSYVRRKLGLGKILTYAAGGATGLAVAGALLTEGTATAAATDLTRRVVGAWSVKATVASTTGSFPPIGSIRWGVFIFTPEGLVIVNSSAPTQGIGVYRLTSSRSISYSLIEQDFLNGNWNGNDNVFAQSVNFSADGLSFTGSSEAWKFDTQGSLLVKIGLNLEGTRVTLTTPDKLPKQTLP